MLPAGLRERAPEIFKRHGLPHMAPMTGMVASTLAPLRRPLPAAEFVRVQDARSRGEVGTINAKAYGIPVEWGVEALDIPSMWPESAFGYVARVGDKTVSTATVVLLETCHYVGLVATLPEFQQNGHAEAVMRHAIQEAERVAGPKQIVLHATAAGKPVYQAMGFREVAPFTGYYASGG
jgi:ribosomal protein S18 acetylase RimI-like enzyme